MQATPPAMPAQALQLMAAQGHSYIYNGAWIFTSKDSPHAWHEPWKNFQPRIGINYRFGKETVLRFG
jgi:putative flippase GtrA